MQKQENFLSEGHRSKKDIKVPFRIGYPHLHIKFSLYVCRRVQGSQILKQLNYLDSFKSYCNSSDLGFLGSGGGAGGWGVSRVNNYSLYELRSVER